VATLPLRFLADESCDFAVVRALRADGHDVLAVSEMCHSLTYPEPICRMADKLRSGHEAYIRHVTERHL